MWSCISAWGKSRINCIFTLGLYGSSRHFLFFYDSVTDLKGVPGTRAPLGVQILSFSYSFRQNNRFSHPLWELAPPSGKSWIRHCDYSENQGKAVADPGFPKGCANLLFDNILTENCIKMKEFGPRNRERSALERGLKRISFTQKIYQGCTFFSFSCSFRENSVK